MGGGYSDMARAIFFWFKTLNFNISFSFFFLFFFFWGGGGGGGGGVLRNEVSGSRVPDP